MTHDGKTSTTTATPATNSRGKAWLRRLGIAPPEMGMPLNLTPHESGLAGWTEAQLREVLRTGRTPSGHQIDARQMPYPRSR